jgi:hypothetical protein
VRYLDDSEHAQFKEVSAVKEVAIYDKSGHATSGDVTKLLFGKMYDPDAAITPEDVAKPAAIAAPAKAAVEDDGFGGAAVAEKPKAEVAAAAKVEKPKREPKASAAAPSKPAETVATAAPSDALAALAAEWDA